MKFVKVVLRKLDIRYKDCKFYGFVENLPQSLISHLSQLDYAAKE
jgi:hypothetical protein